MFYVFKTINAKLDYLLFIVFKYRKFYPKRQIIFCKINWVKHDICVTRQVITKYISVLETPQ